MGSCGCAKASTTSKTQSLTFPNSMKLDINDTLIKTHASEVKVATAYDNVLNTECVYTFHSPYTSSKGILVNMMTFIGTIEEMAFEHVELMKEGMFLRIVKI